MFRFLNASVVLLSSFLPFTKPFRFIFRCSAADSCASLTWENSRKLIICSCLWGHYKVKKSCWKQFCLRLFTNSLCSTDCPTCPDYVLSQPGGFHVNVQVHAIIYCCVETNIHTVFNGANSIRAVMYKCHSSYTQRLPSFKPLVSLL